MKTLFNIVLLACLSTQCGEKSTVKEDPCQLTDSRFVGKWTLLQECKCYNMGGDFVWKTVFYKHDYTFDDKCVVTLETDDNSPCTQGKYSFDENQTTKQPQITISLVCKSGGINSSPYDFLFNLKGDTLILKGYLDEGYVGLKFLKRK